MHSLCFFAQEELCSVSDEECYRKDIENVAENLVELLHLKFFLNFLGNNSKLTNFMSICPEFLAYCYISDVLQILYPAL